MSNALKKFFDTIPKTFDPELNRVMYALLYAIALSDDDVEAAIAEAKNQLFVRTATGRNLEKLGNSLGVAKPQSLGLTDTEFQELIPNLSLKPKTIRKAFYDTADIFWGPLYSRANTQTRNFGPFNVQIGDELQVSVNNGFLQKIKVLTGDLAVNGTATATELVNIFSRIKGATTTVQTEPLTNNEYVNIRTNTPGSVGSIEIYSSSILGTSKVDLVVGPHDILKLDQRVVVYNIRPNELLIEIPAIIPALRRTLRGSHHFHADATIEPAVPPTNGIWQGSFIFSPNGQTNTFTISKQHCLLQQTISKGQIYTSLAVDNNSSFLQPSGDLIFGFGTDQQEGPVKYRGIPNHNTILIDPGYIFKFDHAVNASLNVITERQPYTPLKSGKDLAVYLTSPSGARAVVQTILSSLAAAGIIVKFQILAPTYKYIVDNPYITSDDAPSTN
jgi:hypothetical protein